MLKATNTRYRPQTSVGVVGGGQLARMLALKAHELGLKVSILSPSHDDPAAQVVRFWQQGSPDNLKAIQSFVANLDYATFESEFVPPEVLGKLPPKRFSPHPQLMKTLGDRWSQKNLLKEFQIPTAPFIDFSQASQLAPAIQKLGSNFVLKKRLYGYDGTGTFYVKGGKLPANLLQQATSSSFIAESYIPFQRELAILIARSRAGETIPLPLVETEQIESRCAWVKGPVQHPALPRLVSRLRRMLDKINYVGVIAFELFDTGDKLLVNEVAPRVHNSAHYSLDALSDDQFSLHWKTILGFPLKAPESKSKFFGMWNLLGSSTQTPRFTPPLTGHLHWYGKTQNRRGRKMGHVNVTGASLKEVEKKLIQVKRSFSL